MQSPGKTLFVIVGPTAIGKTAAAIKIAREFQTEIISADSRQFYRETNIGTAKPSAGELQEVRHHFINSHSITETFTVGDFEKESLKLIEKLFKSHNSIVLTGGSGLYVDAVCRGFDNLPKAAPGVRETLNSEYNERGLEFLQKKLKEADPEYYNETDISNPQRIIRALEVYTTTGIPISQYRKGSHKERPFRIVKIGLNTDRETLYNQINFRVDQMISAGLIDEVRSLSAMRELNALKTVGYSELFDYLDGILSLEEAINKIKQNTRNFAKRQLTWFRKDPKIRWFEPWQADEIVKYLNDQLEAGKP